MYNEFDFMFPDHADDKRASTHATSVPDLPLDDPMFAFERASKSFGQVAVSLLRKELATAMLGDTGPSEDPIHELQRVSDNDAMLDQLLKNHGHTGKQLARMRKSMSIDAGMTALFNANQELFDLDQQKLIQKAIAALDISVFLTLFNEALGVV